MTCTSKPLPTSLFVITETFQIHFCPLFRCNRNVFFTFNRLNVSQLVTLRVDSKSISVLCHMGDFGCGDGGWTPVMKIDGNKVRKLFYLSRYITYEILRYIASLTRDTDLRKTAFFDLLESIQHVLRLINNAFLFLFRTPFITTPDTGMTHMNSTSLEGRLALTLKRLSYQPTGTHPSPRFVLE